MKLMKPLVLISHGDMCVELKKSVEMIMGPKTIFTQYRYCPMKANQSF